jgi:hypothetical protein
MRNHADPDPQLCLLLIPLLLWLLTKILAHLHSSVADPDPDPHVFGPPDPDPLVRGMDPDPSIIKQK